LEEYEQVLIYPVCKERSQAPGSAVEREFCLSPRVKNHPDEQLGLANFDLINFWTDHCDAYHPFCHKDTAQANVSVVGGPSQGNAHLRRNVTVTLIDVHSRTLKTAGADDRYIALSYVWGTAPSNPRPDVEESQDRTPVLPSTLPKTVEDAITVVERLGERYLWVDAYCIDQNNRQQREEQIKNMDFIYENAVLTIADCSGTNSGSGLAGVSHPLKYHSQQVFHSSSGDFMAVKIEHMWASTEKSRWSTRGWTMQEGIMSLRCLCFGISHVFMICRGSFYHDVMPTAFFDSRWTHGLRAFDGAAGFRFYIDQPITFAVYSGIVSTYTRRELTYSTDALDAFTGTLNVLSRLTGIVFLYGLPAGDLIEALLWRPENHAIEVISRPEFPSWSWLSCARQVAYSPLVLATNNVLRTVDGRPYHIFQEFLDNPSAGSSWAAGCCSVDSVESAAIPIPPQQFLTSHRIRIQTTRAIIRISKLKEQDQPGYGQYRYGLPHGDLWFLHALDGTRLQRGAQYTYNALYDEQCAFCTDEAMSDHIETTLGEAMQGEFILLQFWQGVTWSDDGDRGQKIEDFVWTWLTFRNQDNIARRIALVCIKNEDWKAAMPEPVDVLVA